MNLKHQISIVVIAVSLAVCPTLSFGALTHVVAKGDTLYSISKKHNITVDQIKTLNGLSSNRISKGAVLVVKASESGLAVKSKSSKAGSAKKSTIKFPSQQVVEYNTYEVERGDTLVIVAREYGLTVSQLKKMNGLKSSKLKVGQRLRVPVVNDDLTVTVSKGRDEVNAGNNEGGQVQLLSSADDTPIDNLSPMEALRVQHLIDVASNYVGVPYKFGGANRKGIDCSAFVQKVFGFLSVDLPRTAREQFRIGEKVAKSELREGDLVFFKTYAKFPSHVGIYIGDNKFIHASSINKQVSVSTLDAPYYTKRYIGAKRLPVQDKF